MNTTHTLDPPQAPSPAAPPKLGQVTFIWAILGISALLLQALFRLTPRALEPFHIGLSIPLWALYFAWALFNVYAEGYRGFHLRFVPRVVKRARDLATQPHPRAIDLWLAPAYAMGLFHAPKKRIIASWITVLAITALVLLVRLMPQPWRGILDAGVVTGLAAGLLSLLYQAARPKEPPAPKKNAGATLKAACSRRA